jgi:hypothetical protein
MRAAFIFEKFGNVQRLFNIMVENSVQNMEVIAVTFS